MSKTVLLLSLLVGTAAGGQEQDTLPALTSDVAPRSFQEMWAGFDPHAEPLEVETLEEWEEDGVVLRVVRFRIGVFKGQKAVLAAVYGYPRGGSELPGLVQILCALAARRALTFLERRPEVDSDRLGVYGHSMGGKITVLTAAADERVKAAAPSCGGISDIETIAGD